MVGLPKNLLEEGRPLPFELRVKVIMDVPRGPAGMLGGELGPDAIPTEYRISPFS
jgi:hypothetical protein